MASESNNRLGRGLDSIASEVSGIKAGVASPAGGYMRIPITDVEAIPGGRTADDALIDSVKKFGFLQPVLVTRAEKGYRLLAGSRRLHAARAIGLTDVPAIVIPPDRAGALDVFLEENINRSELTETARIALRDRWMKETGRDLEQAEERIPEVQWENPQPTDVKSPRLWMIAAGTMAVVSSVLLFMVFNAKPVDKRPVIIPVSMVSPPAVAEEKPGSNDWMNTFRFPNLRREVIDHRLLVGMSWNSAEEKPLSDRAALFLNQLAALIQASKIPLRVDLIYFGADEAVFADSMERLKREGVTQVRGAKWISPSSSSSSLAANIYPAGTK